MAPSAQTGNGGPQVRRLLMQARNLQNTSQLRLIAILIAVSSLNPFAINIAVPSLPTIMGDLATDEGSRIFVRALNDLAHGLDKQVIAEGAETQEVLKLLAEMGTQFAQGNQFQRPMLLERQPMLDVASSATAA